MQALSLVDIGINLTHESFDADRDAVLARAHAAGVQQMIITGTSWAGSQQAIALAHQHPRQCYATVGIHPHHASDLTAALYAPMRELLQSAGVVAVGECGLDYYRDYAPRPCQRAAFEWQLALAIEQKKPLFLHERDAHADFTALLKGVGRDLPPAVAHCFTGTCDQVQQYLAMGLYIGLTGWICDERRGQHLRDVARLIPADRLLLETDAPYLLPRTLRPKPRTRRNEPSYLTEVCRVVADARGDDPTELARCTTINAHRLFNLDGPAVSHLNIRTYR
jgi:TatD DNase family protein